MESLALVPGSKVQNPASFSCLEWEVSLVQPERGAFHSGVAKAALPEKKAKSKKDVFLLFSPCFIRAAGYG